tara:strand:+ start:812 stop:1018 length:207 start_codon:yes stop_codon:yes gene_type:complete
MKDTLIKELAYLIQEEKDKATILTSREASVILRLDYRTLLNKIHQGKYEFKADGYRYTISMYQLKKYL